MPATTEADKSTIDYFLSNYSGFKKRAEELIERNQDHQWIWEYSLFSDPEDFNKLHLIGINYEFGEMERISQYEKGY
jgi:hypothetical protein|tara:strand:+ start:128 stop:358 length:231 start_codon:yes stop_codon:yes gene_type:complete